MSGSLLAFHLPSTLLHLCSYELKHGAQHRYGVATFHPRHADKALSAATAQLPLQRTAAMQAQMETAWPCGAPRRLGAPPAHTPPTAQLQAAVLQAAKNGPQRSHTLSTLGAGVLTGEPCPGVDVMLVPAGPQAAVGHDCGTYTNNQYEA